MLSILGKCLFNTSKTNKILPSCEMHKKQCETSITINKCKTDCFLTDSPSEWQNKDIQPNVTHIIQHQRKQVLTESYTSCQPKNKETKRKNTNNGILKLKPAELLKKSNISVTKRWLKLLGIIFSFKEMHTFPTKILSLSSLIKASQIITGNPFQKLISGSDVD